MLYDIEYRGSFYLRKRFTVDSDQYLSKVDTLGGEI